MRTIRRLYFYGVALVSLEVMIWGAIGLARTVLAQNLVGGRTAPLAQALSLTLVGVPVFLIHWAVAQRDARRDPEERSSLVRAVFLFGGLLGTLIPIAQNGLALLNRVMLAIFGAAPTLAIVGGNQAWTDNLVGMAINAGAAAYLYRVLTADRGVGPGRLSVERLYRYVWLIYSLILVVSGVWELLRYLLYLPTSLTGSPGYRLADGIALLVFGLPLWVGWSRAIQRSLARPEEVESLLRLVVLYLLVLAGVITVLGTVGIALAAGLRLALGETRTPAEFFNEISGPLSIAIPMGGIWAYYGWQLNREVAALPDSGRRAGLRRLYHYLLAAFGFGATFIGMQQTLGFVVNSLASGQVGMPALRVQLSNALAELTVGLPLWWLNWRPMQAEARLTGAGGDHARRSVVRKSALYLALFAMVIGAMVSGGQAAYQVLGHWLGSGAVFVASEAINRAVTCFLFLGWLGYFWLALRGDGHIAEKSLREQHADFPVAVLDPGNGVFADRVVGAIRRTAPEMPVSVQTLDEAPGESLAQARAIVLPVGILISAPESWRYFLAAYGGKRVVVPETDPGTVWVSGNSLGSADLAVQTAAALRQMAEGQPVKVSPPLNAWMVAAYVLGGLFALELVVIGAAAAAQAFFR